MPRVRDRVRVANLKTFHLAILQYMNDHDNVAPITRCLGTNPDPYDFAAFEIPVFMDNIICTSPGGPMAYPNLAAALAPYTKPLLDPWRTQTDFGFKYTSEDGVDYAIILKGTPENMHNFSEQYWPVKDYGPPCGACCPGQPDADGQCELNAVRIKTVNSMFF